MKITWSQKSYEVRDASEIALGLLFLGIVSAPLSLLLGFLILSLWVSISGAAFTAESAWWMAGLLWVACMALILWHYRRVTRVWAEERRGSDTLSLIQGMAALVGGLLSLIDPDGFLPMARLFFAGLIGLLVVCHSVTYAMLRYRPRRADLLVWGLSAAFVVWEFSR